MSYRFLDSLRAGSGRNYSQAVIKPVWHIPLLCVQWKTRDDGQRNCPKHVQFYSKNKFEKLVHLVGFIVRIYHDARSAERQINEISLCLKANMCIIVFQLCNMVARNIYNIKFNTDTLSLYVAFSWYENCGLFIRVRTLVSSGITVGPPWAVIRRTN